MDNVDMQPVRKWMEGLGKIVYAPTEKLRSELYSHQKMRKQFDVYRENGKLKQINPHEVDAKKESLSGLKSNDPDVIALALVADVKLLISGDRNLHEDFKSIVQGSVYQNRKHCHLLKPDTCP
ncbi:MAG: hypothetical protein OXO51_08100 [Gemmatimonadota bacterium]|nr:hypothetical protein [Gemmatimonadota bacterium]